MIVWLKRVVWKMLWFLSSFKFSPVKKYILGGPQKYPYFSLAITFTKMRKPRFFLQLLEVHRILLVEANLESITFYYTFSVINTIFVPCTILLYDNRAATRTLKLFTTLLSISCGILWFLFCWYPLLSVNCFHKFFLSGTPSENSLAGWDLGNRMARSYRSDSKWVCPMGSYA